MSVRVLHINGERGWRGGERQTLLTVVEQRRQGLDSRLACRGGAALEAEARAAGVPVIALATSPALRLVQLTTLVGRFDLVHCHTAKSHSLVSLALLGRRMVLLGHRLALLGRRTPLVGRRTALVVSRRVDFVPKRTLFNRYKYRRADRVACVSEYIAGQLRSWGVPPASLRVIRDGVPDEPRPGREESLRLLRQYADVAPGRPIVGNIAALVWHKDQATLLRAARELVRLEPDVAVVVVGEGNLRDELLRLRARLGLERHVFFTGFVPQAQRLLPAFDVFAMSSSMEGLGSSVLDAGLAGVPVAATAAGGLPEIVRHEETGLLAPVGDFRALAGAIARLLSDPALAARLARAAGAQARQAGSPAAMAHRYVQLYRELIGSAAPAAPAAPTSVPARAAGGFRG